MANKNIKKGKAKRKVNTKKTSSKKLGYDYSKLDAFFDEQDEIRKSEKIEKNQQKVKNLEQASSDLKDKIAEEKDKLKKQKEELIKELDKKVEPAVLPEEKKEEAPKKEAKKKSKKEPAKITIEKEDKIEKAEIKVEKVKPDKKKSKGKRKNFFVDLFTSYKKTLSKKKDRKANKKDKKKDKKKKNKFNANYIVIGLFALIILFTSVSMFIPRDYKKLSSLVRGNLTDTEDMDGIEKLEADFENEIIIRFPFYEGILKGYFGTIQKQNEANFTNANDNALYIIDAKQGIYRDKQFDQLIRKYEVKEENQDIELNHRVKLFNAMAKVLKERNVNAYIYAVSGIWTSEAILNFDLDYKEPLKYVNKFAERINDYIKFDYLKIIDYTTFKEYFFATDHHWRIHGAYQGYKDIMTMFGIPEEELVPADFYKVPGVKFMGSNARICACDELKDYLFDIKFDEDYKVEVNGKEKEIDELSHADEYKKGEFSDEEYYNHYASYFHEDIGELVYTFDKNKKANEDDEKRVLIIADSYSNCIDKVIASHFYKTYVIDLRYYEQYNDEKFILTDYIDEHEITDVLVMLSANSIYFESADLDMGLEKATGVKKDRDLDK